MAIYTSAQAASVNPQIDMTGGGFTVFGSIALTTPLAANDIVQLCAVSNGYKVLEVLFDSDPLDSNAAPTLTGTVGDAGSAGRYVTVTAAQFKTGIITPNNVPASLGFVYAPNASGGNAGNSVIQFKCTNPAATWVNGTMRCAVTLQIDNPSFA